MPVTHPGSVESKSSWKGPWMCQKVPLSGSDSHFWLRTIRLEIFLDNRQKKKKSVMKISLNLLTRCFLWHCIPCAPTFSCEPQKRIKTWFSHSNYNFHRNYIFSSMGVFCNQEKQYTWLFLLPPPTSAIQILQSNGIVQFQGS